MFKVYLAASWSRKNEIRGYIPLFDKYGIKVQSQWLFERAAATAKIHEVDDQYILDATMDDLDDIEQVDALILFSNGYDSKNVGGGRFFEAGIAFARNKPVITVGEPEMIFQKMPETELMYVVPDVYGAVSLILTWQNEILQEQFKAKARQDNIELVERINQEPGQNYALFVGE